MAEDETSLAAWALFCTALAILSATVGGYMLAGAGGALLAFGFALPVSLFVFFH